MFVKITNCTFWVGGGKTPKRLRKGQNLHINLPDGFFRNISCRDFVKKYKWSFDYFNMTNTSKVVLPQPEPIPLSLVDVRKRKIKKIM
jgi:hypothetical protein